MMRWIVGSSLKFRYIVAAAAAGLMFFGVEQLRGMPVDVFPEFAPPRVEIQTLALGLSATEVENLVTVPLEQALNGVPDLDTIRSKSVEHRVRPEIELQSLIDLSCNVGGSHSLCELGKLTFERQLLSVVEASAHFEPNRRAVLRGLEPGVHIRRDDGTDAHEHHEPPAATQDT